MTLTILEDGIKGRLDIPRLHIPRLHIPRLGYPSPSRGEGGGAGPARPAHE